MESIAKVYQIATDGGLVGYVQGERTENIGLVVLKKLEVFRRTRVV